MPRRARLLLPGMPLHIVQRGHNRQPCFHTESDYMVYLERLREHACTSGCSVHAYVLMTNHVHILASFADITAAPHLIRLLGQQYSLYLNRRLGRTGTTWEGRYWSCPVPTEHYLLNCQRYIEANPIRAGMADRPDQYRWSSYRGNAGLADDPLLDRHELYLRLGGTDRDRQRSYRQLSACNLSDFELNDIREALKEASVAGLPRRRPGRPRKSEAQ